MSKPPLKKPAGGVAFLLENGELCFDGVKHTGGRLFDLDFQLVVWDE
ncbi:MAG: hypothetical protein UW41_C0025G0019 [Candidatus Collierbacteria bacterium GW2011_GWC2_44_18]|uniref:Uncharacterized protein n=1 Tax=Candidatus Collierbacteria bacterium GW2011_GWC2_44_18 TaxID=1618392 RepID=A0A0G1HPH2_9BACT|nr:MAG: hypothetical protein UW41_C0025G0019 [Candidatus Collierbacteria bacterium GW2011_GWC2_44_18]